MSILCEHFKKAHCKTQYKKPAKNVKIQKRPVKHSEYYDNKCAICEKVFINKIDLMQYFIFINGILLLFSDFL